MLNTESTRTPPPPRVTSKRNFYSLRPKVVGVTKHFNSFCYIVYDGAHGAFHCLTNGLNGCLINILPLFQQSHSQFFSIMRLATVHTATCSPQACSIGLRSCDIVGQSSTLLYLSYQSHSVYAPIVMLNI